MNDLLDFALILSAILILIGCAFAIFGIAIYLDCRRQCQVMRRHPRVVREWIRINHK
jgi:hypothetical protein